MPTEFLSSDMQLDVLTDLADIYPNMLRQSEMEADFTGQLERFDFNLFYMWDKKWVIWWSDPVDEVRDRKIRITAQGIDHLIANIG